MREDNSGTGGKVDTAFERTVSYTTLDMRMWIMVE